MRTVEPSKLVIAAPPPPSSLSAAIVRDDRGQRKRGNDYARPITRTSVFLSLAILVLAGCGGGTTKTVTTKPFEAVAAKRSPGAVAACLNARTFLVQANGQRVSGSSPGGVNFEVTFFPNARAERIAQIRHHYLTKIVSATLDNVGIDDSGNPPAHPGGPPMGLPAVDLHTIVVCILHG